MIYIFEVRDDEMCSLPCKEFNKFADAFDYAQDGLTTRIFQVPVEDGCEPCYDECKCVWDWSTPEDRNTLVRLFDGCSPSPICEDVADKNDLDARLQAEYKRRLAKYADLFGYDSGEELEDAMNEDGDLYDEVVATDDGDNFLYLYSFYPDTDKEWENDIDDYYEQPLEDVLIGVLEDAENKRGPVQEKLTVDELRDLAEPSIEESPEYWNTIERDKAIKSIDDFDDDIDYISEDDLDNDIILDEGKVLDKLKNVFSKKKKEEPAAGDKKDVKTTDTKEVDQSEDTDTEIKEPSKSSFPDIKVKSAEEIAADTTAFMTDYLNKHPKEAEVYKNWYKTTNTDELAKILSANPFQSAEKEQKALNTGIVKVADEIMSNVGATAEENKFDDIKVDSKLEINPFEAFDDIDVEVPEKDPDKYADLERELGVRESLEKDLMEGKLFDKIKSAVEKHKATKDSKQEPTKEITESRLDQLLKMGNEKWQEKLKLEKEFEQLKALYQKDPKNASIITRGNTVRCKLNSVLYSIQLIATEIKREELMALTGKDPLAKPATQPATVTEDYDDDISDEEFLEELGKALYGNK